VLTLTTRRDWIFFVRIGLVFLLTAAPTTDARRSIPAGLDAAPLDGVGSVVEGGDSLAD
jgi:hypothetical protein